jgi:TetR/AcrR family tetracycline transcriptional repressor
MPKSTGSGEVRGRGRPARIDREQILEAARALGPENLTMQAVAERLGVHRKALNYHVRDREGLLELLLVDALNSELGKCEIVLHGDWREVLRSFALAIRETMVRTGEFYDYAHLRVATGLLTLAWVERVAEGMIDAGFDERTAAFALTLVSELTYASARDAAIVARHGEHPQYPQLRQFLERVPEEELPLMRRWLAQPRAGSDEQFAFDLDTLIAGLERRLDQ